MKTEIIKWELQIANLKLPLETRRKIHSIFIEALQKISETRFARPPYQPLDELPSVVHLKNVKVKNDN